MMNGEQTHPLSPAALNVLASLAVIESPRQEINPGIVDRLTQREVKLAIVVELPSPYRKDRGKNRTVPHLRITAEGLAEVAAAKAARASR